MTTAVESARTEFASIVGEARAVTDPAACAGLPVDGKAPTYAAYPRSAEEVAAVLKCAARHDLAVISCRGGTKLEIGNLPRRYDVALSLKEMNRVWYYEPEDLTISVEPGMKFGDFQQFVGRHGLWLPLDPAGGARASLGGILATNSSGPLRVAYGAARDMVLGMKIATTEGKVIKTGGRVVKNVAGYDLAKLLIGSYGTLGVIVEASFKLYPVPAGRATFVFPAGALGIARDLRRRILQSFLQPMRLVLLDATASTMVRAGTTLESSTKDYEIWVEAGGSARVVDRYGREFEELGRAAGVPVERLSAEDAEASWSRISDIRAALPAESRESAILKVTLPVSASEEFLSRARQEAESEKVRLAGLAQVGVGVMHLCLLGGTGSPGILGLVNRLRRAATDLGGALIVERCPVELKNQLDVWGTPCDDFEIMRELKAVWDPKGILAPGRFAGGL